MLEPAVQTKGKNTTYLTKILYDSTTLPTKHCCLSVRGRKRISRTPETYSWEEVQRQASYSTRSLNRSKNIRQAVPRYALKRSTKIGLKNHLLKQTRQPSSTGIRRSAICKDMQNILDATYCITFGAIFVGQSHSDDPM